MVTRMICHFEFLVEEDSMAATLDAFVPSVLAGRASYRVITFRGKQKLLQQLPSRFQGYGRRVGREPLGIVVLIDQDRQDCLALKAQLEKMALSVGLFTKSSPTPSGHFHVVNRIVVEELESWFFGDIEAMRVPFPRLSPTLAAQSSFRNPDTIRGGTAERLHTVLRRAGYYADYIPKLEVARLIAPHLVPERNRSRSFRIFISGVEAALQSLPRSAPPDPAELL